MSLRYFEKMRAFELSEPPTFSISNLVFCFFSIYFVIPIRNEIVIVVFL